MTEKERDMPVSGIGVESGGVFNGLERRIGGGDGELTEEDLMGMSNKDLIRAYLGERERRLNAEAQVETLKTLTGIDPLTGLGNRRAFDNELDVAVGTTNRTGQDFSLVFMDVDNFKTVNDTYGHQAGDNVLEKFGEFLRTTISIRESDRAFLYGGDEFALILSQTTLYQGKSLGFRVRDMFASFQDSVYLGLDEKVTLSIGVACYRQTSNSIEALVKHADLAMYEAKNSGKDWVGVYNLGRVELDRIAA